MHTFDTDHVRGQLASIFGQLSFKGCTAKAVHDAILNLRNNSLYLSLLSDLAEVVKSYDSETVSDLNSSDIEELIEANFRVRFLSKFDVNADNDCVTLLVTALNQATKIAFGVQTQEIFSSQSGLENSTYLGMQVVAQDIGLCVVRFSIDDHRSSFELEPVLFDVFYCLYLAKGEHVAKEHLLDKFYTDRSKINLKNLRARISAIKNKFLNPRGITIASYRKGEKYALKALDEQA